MPGTINAINATRKAGRITQRYHRATSVIDPDLERRLPQTASASQGCCQKRACITALKPSWLGCSNVGCEMLAVESRNVTRLSSRV